jgi:hypothetical protein
MQDQEPIPFVFLPGEKVTLGHDRTHPFRPTAEQLESWQLTVRQGWLSCTLEDYLDTVMSPLREVTLDPFLLQVSLTNPMTPEVLPDGRIKYHRSIRFDDVRRIVTTEGFRLPHADEWEYACSAGARTLFRWGNETPSETIPDPEEDDEFEWKEHLRPNAFGLSIAMNPYHWELCGDPAVTIRGGDGGTALHRGVGTFAEWLTLASPFVRKIQNVFLEDGEISGLHFRRLYPLKNILIKRSSG